MLGAGMAKHTPEERQAAVEAFRGRGRRPVAEVAAEHRVSETTLRRWARSTDPGPAAGRRRPLEGPLVRTVREHVEALRREHQLDTHGVALCELALALARQLDAAAGDPDVTRYVAGWSRELRQTLDAITPKGEPDDRDDDAWLDDLEPDPPAAEVRHSSQP